MVAYAAGIVENPDCAQDVVQETFIRPWRRRSEWTPTGSVGAYLYRITRNVALNAQRDRKAESNRRERSGHGFGSFASCSNPHDDLLVRTLREELEGAIAALQRAQRAWVGDDLPDHPGIQPEPG